MKKISIITLLSVFVFPAMAEDVTVSVAEQYAQYTETEQNEQVESDVVAQYNQQFEQPEFKDDNNDDEIASNPETRFPHGMQLGVGISPTSGLNGFIGYNNKKFESFWAKRFGVRLDFAGYSPIKRKLNKTINNHIDDGGFEIGDDLKINNFALNAKHFGALIDFYPFGDTWFLGGWRVSGGYFTGKLDLDADIYGTSKDGKIEFELNDHKYYYAGDKMCAKAVADWKYNGPYAGTGFDLGLFYGFKIYFDAGVVFTDKTAKIDLNIPTDNLSNENSEDIIEGTIAYTQFKADKDATLEDARKTIKDYPYYPIVKLGFMYRF